LFRVFFRSKRGIAQREDTEHFRRQCPQQNTPFAKKSAAGQNGHFRFSARLELSNITIPIGEDAALAPSYFDLTHLNE
jgi:hypothetical protein